MTLQNRTISVTSTWHGARTLLVTPSRQKKFRTHVLQCTTPVSADDVFDLREIAQEIIGIADVRRSDLKDMILIDFVDSRISDKDIETLTREVFRLAVRHSAPAPHYPMPSVSPVELAMAVHSEVRRFDSFD